MRTLIAICFLSVATVQGCPPGIEQSYTVRGPGGAYGYTHLSWQDEGRGPVVHQHVIVLGRRTFNVTGLSLVVGSVVFISLAAATWWGASRRHATGA
jgi:hypothetical protein